MAHPIVNERTMSVVTEHIPSAKRITEEVRSRKLLYHPHLRRILSNIKNENNKFSNAKLVEAFINFMQEPRVPDYLPPNWYRKYLHDEIDWLQLGNNPGFYDLEFFSTLGTIINNLAFILLLFSIQSYSIVES